MLPVDLTADCSRCTALCCIAYPFSHDAGFPFDKPANQRCVLLCDDDRCSVYEDRAASGLQGCIQYECYGAGQWITSTRKGRAENAADTLERFRLVRSVHELLAMMRIAVQHSPDPEARSQLEQRAQRLRSLRDEPHLRDLRVQFSAERAQALLQMKSLLGRARSRALAHDDLRRLGAPDAVHQAGGGCERFEAKL